MGQEFSTKPNEQRYAERYSTKYSGYFYGLGFVGLLLSFGGYMFRHDMPDGMYRSTAVIQFVVITSFLLLLLYMKGTSSGPFHPLLVSSHLPSHHPSSSNTSTTSLPHHSSTTRKTLSWCTHYWCNRYQCRSHQWLVRTHGWDVRWNVCLCKSRR